MPDAPEVDVGVRVATASSDSLTSDGPYPLIDPSELVIGLVYGAGTDVEPVETLLAQRLKPYAYSLETIHLSEAFPSLLGVTGFDRRSPEGIERLQNMGDELRRSFGDEVNVGLAVHLIREARAQLRARQPRPETGQEAPLRVVWLVRSLRRPEEVEGLRRIYGPRFLLLGVHVPEHQRLGMARRRVRRYATTSSAQFDVQAMREIRRDDEDLDDPHGQAVRRTFSRSDLIVDFRSTMRLNASLPRLVDILFGDSFQTPEPDEQAMYWAYSAGVRSSEMGRQVGAALIVEPFQCVALGVNEVPSPRGRPYHAGDDPDGRDFAQEPAIDSNTDWKRRVGRELVARLAQREWLSEERAAFLPHRSEERDGQTPLLEAVQYVPEDLLNKLLADLDGTRLADLIEFGRAVHAEMDAIISAGRRGIAIDGGTLVTTTFPCHNCTRHLIISGVKRVLYLHPYTKTLAYELHADAVAPQGEAPPQEPHVRFDQFTGVAPRLFTQFFDPGSRRRKDDVTGEALRQVPSDQVEPLPLRAHNAWTYEGPRTPAVVLTDIEGEAAERFVAKVTGREAVLPAVPIREGGPA